MEPISMAAMAALALMTTKMNNAAQAKAQKSNADMAAAQTRYSPYTDMGKGSFQALPQQSELGGAVQGAVAGLNLSQSYAKAESEKAMMDRMQNTPSGEPVLPTDMPIMTNDYFKKPNPYDSGPRANSPWVLAGNNNR